MSRVLGIDRRDQRIRAALLRVSYRKLELEQVSEESIADHASEAEAVQACVARWGGLQGIDTVVSALEGGKTFIHLLGIPASAEKRLNDLLPFELEAQLPIELDRVVFDHQLLPKSKGASETLQVFTVASQIDQVRACIEQVREAVGREPDMVAVSSVSLGQLSLVSSALRTQEAVVVLDVGTRTTDACLLQGGIVRGARSLDVGVNDFPDRALLVGAQLKQTLYAFRTVTAQPPTKIFLVGEGSLFEGLGGFLQTNCELPVESLRVDGLEGVTEANRAQLSSGARALALALQGAKGKGIDLRRGELAFQRGYSFVKEKAPLLLGALAVILLSFVFSSWAKGRALDREHEMLEASLEQVTQAIFSQATTDPDEAWALLERAKKARPEDPMPYLDGFGAAVAFAEVLPEDIRHDLEQFEFTKSKLKLRGLIDKADEAQKIAQALEGHRCFSNAKITKISQVVNSERERYILEADGKCPEDPGFEKKKEATP